ncbi:ROK family protein [Nonomuraea basaltis]|uniref:ROK family protein n=1 Tax=Nonomuraea basaltis TaxID=2495887 RepID=UPI00110C4CAA|nr:ROK family protein [Nonomuraea basaltis]TMR94881.1 ROK family protein [Nonomuraea basaltis]
MNQRRSTLRGDLTPVEILALLGTAGALDRRQIATRLRLGIATVHEHTGRLLSSGYLRALAPQTGTVGRPRIPLQVVPEAAATIGIRVAADHLVSVVVGLDGRIMTSDQSSFDHHSDPVPQLLDAIRRYLGDPSVGPRLKGVGVAVPDPVDPATGYIRFSPRFGWTDLPLGQRLRAELPIPVLVDNVIRASTTAELLYGAGREHDDFLVLGIGDGVGLGAVLHRRVHRSPNGLSGEFGHTPVSSTGPRCPCGARGCLETFTSDRGILRAARRKGLADADTSIEAVRTRSASGEPAIIELLAEIGTILGRAIAGVVNLLGTPAIAVIGENHDLWPGLEPGFLEAMQASPVAAAHHVKVIVRPWHDSQHAHGAASLALAHPETFS